MPMLQQLASLHAHGLLRIGIPAYAHMSTACPSTRRTSTHGVGEARHLHAEAGHLGVMAGAHCMSVCTPFYPKVLIASV